MYSQGSTQLTTYRPVAKGRAPILHEANCLVQVHNFSTGVHLFLRTATSRASWSCASNLSHSKEQGVLALYALPYHSTVPNPNLSTYIYHFPLTISFMARSQECRKRFPTIEIPWSVPPPYPKSKNLIPQLLFPLSFFTRSTTSISFSQHFLTVVHMGCGHFLFLSPTLVF